MSKLRAVQVHGVRLAAIASLVAIGMTACAGRQPIVARDDVTITTDVQSRLAADTTLNGSGITVDTNAGVVRLGGSVQTDTVRDTAERVARETPGVRSVDNRMMFGLTDAPAVPITR